MDATLTRRDFLKIIAVTPFLTRNIRGINQQLPTFDQSSPNILIIVFDALSARNMSLFGYPRVTTPNLDKFAKNATVFHRHYSGANFTTPGTATLLTGTYPWTHRALHMHGTVCGSYEQRSIFNFLPPNIYRFSYSHNLLVTSLLHQFRDGIDEFLKTRDLCLVDDQISDLLFDKDFNTAFWSEWLLMRGGESKPSSIFLSLFHRILRHIHKRDITQVLASDFPLGIPNLHNLFFVLEDAIDWIMEQSITAPQPYFGYVHLLPPHEPYTTRQEFVGKFNDGFAPNEKKPHSTSGGLSQIEINQERQKYDEYLAYADHEFGRLHSFLIKNQILDNTYVFFTSDHGELFERGIVGHVTNALYEPVIHVPLIVSKPGQQTREDIFSPTNHVDILPTILSILDQEIPVSCEGAILPSFQNDRNSESPSVYAVEAKSNNKLAKLTSGTIALIKDDLKLIKYLGVKNTEKEFEMFDLSNDPEELFDIFSPSNQQSYIFQNELEEKLNFVNQQCS